MKLGLSLGIGSRNAGNPIARLFTGGQAGAWFSPRDSSSVWQDSGRTTPAAVGDPVGALDDVSPNTNNLLQATALSRMTRQTNYVQGDMTADHLTCATGGGATTAFYMCFGIRHLVNGGAVQQLFADRVGNTGILFQIATTGRVQLSCGNGAALITASPTTALTDGQNYVLSGWYNGTTITCQIDAGASDPATITTAAVTLSAGAAGFNVGANLTPANFFGGRLYEAVYIRNTLPSQSQRESVRAYIASISV